MDDSRPMRPPPLPQRGQGAIRLFRFAGINVFLHWSWFLVALIEINQRKNSYSSLAWNIAEYVTLFAIVLMHEFGHALACRSVGGTAERIVLWPLGGIAFVNPPPRPGALLWSIAAGPLVNAVLVPVFYVAAFALRHVHIASEFPDFYRFVRMVANINLVLLVFNMLPIYPLDGGQILRALLWFPLGRSRSLRVASIIGMVGGVAMIGLAVFAQSVWIGVLAAFVLSLCWQGFKQAGLLRDLSETPSHRDYACPSCGAPPPRGAFWKCDNCGTAFDTFEQQSICPKCGKTHDATACAHCGRTNPFTAWRKG
ncbi:MAG: M50 family metallopeptidase [Verrucomicrobiota bacterium]|nr:M50 family metallopeptidase [Verrucomicrobiota bacterium]